MMMMKLPNRPTTGSSSLVLLLVGAGSLVLLVLLLSLPDGATATTTTTTTTPTAGTTRPDHVVLDGTLFYPANDPGFIYTGRWQISSEEEESEDERNVVARADWPCSGVQFRVRSTTTSTNGALPSSNNSNSSILLTLKLSLNRVRVHVVVTNGKGQVVSATILQGGNALWGGDVVQEYDILLENDNDNNNDDENIYTISLTKLTQASPYMNGVGKPLKSVLGFHGVDIAAEQTNNSQLPQLVSSSSLPQSQRQRRRVALIGASDTAGYCVDGTPDTSDAKLQPWKYDNCDMASHAVLARRLNAETSVQAMAGIGLTQNAFADKPFLLGKDTMPDYYGRELQTEKEPLWNLAQWRPDVVLVSLGGNDFNHQKSVPSNETFQAAYQDFLEQIAEPYLLDEEEQEDVAVGQSRNGTTVPPLLTIVSICGQGDPTETERDPNNDRCRPCPHVQDATEAFRRRSNSGSTSSRYRNIRVEYIFIPCNGTVVTGVGDIGCEGHKNRLGQKRVADFLEPRLREIMGWNDDNNDNDNENSSSTHHEPAKAVEFPTQDAFYELMTHQEAEVVNISNSSSKNNNNRIKTQLMFWAGLVLLTTSLILIIRHGRRNILGSSLAVSMQHHDDDTCTKCHHHRDRRRDYKKCSTTTTVEDDDDENV